MHTGFYNIRREGEDFVDVLAKEPAINLSPASFMSKDDCDNPIILAAANRGDYQFDAGAFLHGVCGFFALALYNAFGYSIEAVCELPEEEDEDIEWDQTLIHIFCKKGNKLIDVRGITDDDIEFLDEFNDFFETEDDLWFQEIPATDLKDWLDSINSSENVIRLYSDAEKFIRQHRDYYVA